MITKNKTKHRSKIILVVIAILGIFLLLYIFQNRISNFIALNTKSPKEYYAYIMNKRLDESIENIFDLSKQKKENASDSNVNTPISKTMSIDALFGNNFIYNLLNKTSTLDSVHTIGLDYRTQSKKDKKYALLDLHCNDNDLLNIMTQYDSQKKQFYLSIPELSEGTFFFSPDSSKNSSDSFLSHSNQKQDTKRLSKSKKIKLIKKYIHFYMNQIKSVTLERNVKLTSKHITKNTTKLSFSFTLKELLTSFNNLLEEVSYDSDIEDIIVSSNICSTSEYHSFLSLCTLGLNMYFHDKDMDGNIDCSIWVDDSGNIIGRNISVSYRNSKIIVAYKTLRKGSQIAYDGLLQYNASNDDCFKLTAKGSGRLDGFNFNGDLNTIINYQSQANSNKNSNYHGAFSYQIKDLFKLDKESLTLNGLLYQDTDIKHPYKIDFTYDRSDSSALFKAYKDDTKYMTIEVTQKKESEDSFQMQLDQSQIYDGLKGLLPYISSLDFSKLFNQLHE
ncbi:hypothetical protein [Anaeromicropila herbilytica]|uniref:Uncharacterized protein n=1 Tax=Anaeromicropila herbilytica TaxID=2785025 RepID=A0A7R7EPT3_9FIRM|nr:hypothetical protein [Anaeromicropila herbilytica]BCN32495.1 hypothetical protein bsdtb5_37900 [Anaeromicropila herbilytica]